MAPREKWTDDGFDRVENRIAAVENKVDGLGNDVIALDRKVDALDKGFGELEARVGALETKGDEGFAHLDRDMRELRGELKALNRNLLAAAVAIVVALIGTTGTLAGIALL